MLERLPLLSDDFAPPIVLGTAALTTLAFGGQTIEQLRQRVDARDGAIAREFDHAILQQLAFQKAAGLTLQADTLATCQMFRVASRLDHPALRLLAIMAPGDLMVNAPLDFICGHLDARLDLLYLLPGRPLPAVIADHDLAFFAVSEADTPLLERLQALYLAWPRPVLNDPGHMPLFARDTLSRSLAGIPTICCPPTQRMTRAEAAAATTFPCLIRPLGSHAGIDLAKLSSSDDTAAYLALCGATAFYLSAFVDYRGSDGLFRKYRVAFIDRAPYLCHMAVSDHWMIHYLNAGMTESAAKRADEARAMATFDTGFARRHAAAFDALNDLFALDYYSIDCAETADGRLLVFEADTGAIIHMMDPPDLFPYKRPQMARVFHAFGEMLQSRCLTRVPA